MSKRKIIFTCPSLKHPGCGGGGGGEVLQKFLGEDVPLGPWNP